MNIQTKLLLSGIVVIAAGTLQGMDNKPMSNEELFRYIQNRSVSPQTLALEMIEQHIDNSGKETKRPGVQCFTVAEPAGAFSKKTIKPYPKKKNLT